MCADNSIVSKNWATYLGPIGTPPMGVQSGTTPCFLSSTRGRSMRWTPPKRGNPQVQYGTTSRVQESGPWVGSMSWVPESVPQDRSMSWVHELGPRVGSTSWVQESGGGLGLINERPWTDHVIFEPMRGLQIYIDIHCNSMTDQAQSQWKVFLQLGIQLIESVHTFGPFYIILHTDYSCI